jgi:methylmalonyl-CoA/ethylmalonyl-CoA epimerase
MDFGLSQIGQIALTISDIDTAIAFYRDKLGLKFLFQAGNLGFFDCGGVRLMLSPAETPEPRSNSVLYFKVSDLAQARGELMERGVAFDDEPHLIARMPDHNLWMTFFRDQDRNLLGLMSEVRRT